MNRIILFLLSSLLLTFGFACTNPTAFPVDSSRVEQEAVVLTDAPLALQTDAPTVSPIPTPAPTLTPAPTPEPTFTPKPTPSPEPTATPEPFVAFASDFMLVTQEREARIKLISEQYKSMPRELAAELRLEDGSVVGSGVLRARKENTISFTLPVGSPPRTTLYLYIDGTPYPVHSRDVAVVDKEYRPHLGNYERSDKMIAFTFDCAYGEKYTDFLLDTLKAHNVRATFFMTGSWVGNHGPWIERMIAEGHELGSHSMTHPRLTELPQKRVIREIQGASDRIYENHGYRVHLFRPPYGACNPTISAIARFHGQEVINWGQISKDAVPEWTGKRIIELLLKETQPGDIVLCHNGSPELVVYLDPVLTELEARGFTFGTVSELMGWTWDDTFKDRDPSLPLPGSLIATPAPDAVSDASEPLPQATAAP